MAGERDTEFTINPLTGELMIHLHGVDLMGWDHEQAILEADLGKAIRMDKSKVVKGKVNQHVHGHGH